MSNVLQKSMHRSFFIISLLLISVAITSVGYHYFSESRFVGGAVAIYSGTPPDHGLLGVGFGLPPNEMILAGVLPAGPAWDVGLNVGDRLVGIDGTITDSVQQFQSMIRKTRPGDIVTIHFVRNSEEDTVDVELCDISRIRQINFDLRYQEEFPVPISEQ